MSRVLGIAIGLSLALLIGFLLRTATDSGIVRGVGASAAGWLLAWLGSAVVSLAISPSGGYQINGVFVDRTDALSLLIALALGIAVHYALGSSALKGAMPILKSYETVVLAVLGAICGVVNLKVVR
jgi:hypothetical protein